MIREADGRCFVGLGYDLMGFVNDKQGQPCEQDAAKVPKQRVGLLHGHDQDHGLLAGQPHVGDAPVGTAVETGDDDVAAQLRAKLRLDLTSQCARRYDVERERSETVVMRAQQQFLDEREVCDERFA